MQMLEYLQGEEHKKKPLVLHGFSVGGYVYADTIYTIISNPDKYGKSKLCAYIFWNLAGCVIIFRRTMTCLCYRSIQVLSIYGLRDNNLT